MESSSIEDYFCSRFLKEKKKVFGSSNPKICYSLITHKNTIINFNINIPHFWQYHGAVTTVNPWYMMAMCRLKAFWLHHCTGFLLSVSAVSSGFKLVYITELCVFITEFKRFTLDLTALFSSCVTQTHQRVNASALVSLHLAAVWNLSQADKRSVWRL